MKNTIFLFVLLFCFFSCNNEEKYQGKWTNWFLKDIGYNETKNVLFENDSIKFNYTYFDFWNKFPLTIEKGKLKFNNITINTSIEKDTLTINDSIFFVKDDLDTLYGFKPLLKIDLPQIQELIKTNKKDHDIVYYVYYGKRLDNDEFVLQLNDKYADLTELPAFLSNSRPYRREELIPFHSIYLFIDKTTPMKFVEDIFYNLKIVNQLNICLINNINLKFNDTLGLYYEYERLTKRLPPFRENDYYNIYTSTKLNTPPPPPPLYLTSIDNKSQETKLILLKKDTIYFNDEITKPNDLKKLVKPWIENTNTILSFYDLESTYGTFLEMNAIINSAYKEVREEHSKIKFNKPLNGLTREEMDDIKIKIKMYHIWSYSIPHYNAVVENNNSFFSLKVNSNN